MMTKKKKKSLTINCRVPQGLILGSQLFIVYVNDLYCASNILKHIMFADYTNLLSSENFLTSKH